MNNKRMNSRRTRWHLLNAREPARYSADRRVEATYWAKNRRNKFKLVTESMTELEYIYEFAHKKFRDGFYNGARVATHYLMAMSSDRIDNLAANIKTHHFYARGRYHSHERHGTLTASMMRRA